LDGIRRNRIAREKEEQEKRRQIEEAREKERAKRQQRIPKIIITDYDEEMRQLKSSMSSFRSETSASTAEQLKIKLEIPICDQNETDYPPHPNSIIDDDNDDDKDETDAVNMEESSSELADALSSPLVENPSNVNGGEDENSEKVDISLLAPPSMTSLSHEGLILGEGAPSLADDTGKQSIL